ncbi:hypothetical protein RDI58_023519 [Solanum bulbocastanum]|uniref:Uncharacterized protein n=1 Tax=Solanum bulbocastanum TaxID=147425 RepID=A0AAN8T637_SOLBU
MAKQVLKNHDLAFSTRFIPDALQAHNYCKFSAAWLPVCPQWRMLRKVLNTKPLSTNRLDANQHLRSQKAKQLIDYCEKCSQQGKGVDVEILGQPEIMKKVQVELAEVVGKGKPIEEVDVSRLPYLQFIIKETLRLHPPAPFLIPRRVDQDVELCDYIIPKGSLVLVNAWAIGRDPSFWDDALVFKPERFQSLELDMRGKDFEMIPFGAGRRTCPVFPLALRLMPAILGSMLNSFNWKLEACIEPKDLDMEEKFGVILGKAHPLQAIPSPL